MTELNARLMFGYLYYSSFVFNFGSLTKANYRVIITVIYPLVLKCNYYISPSVTTTVTPTPL